MAFLIPMVLATDVLVVLEAVQDSSVPWSSHDSGDTEWSPFTSFLFAIFCSLTTVDCPTQGDWDCLREKWATSSHWINQLFHPSYHFAIIEEKGRWKWEKKKKRSPCKDICCPLLKSLSVLAVTLCFSLCDLRCRLFLYPKSSRHYAWPRWALPARTMKLPFVLVYYI